MALTLGGGGRDTTGRVDREGVPAESLATLYHPPVSVHGESSKMSVRVRKKRGWGRKRRPRRVTVAEEEDGIQKWEFLLQMMDYVTVSACYQNISHAFILCLRPSPRMISWPWMSLSSLPRIRRTRRMGSLSSNSSSVIVLSASSRVCA